MGESDTVALPLGVAEGLAPTDSEGEALAVRVLVAEREALRVGVVFDRPTPETQRATQRYVFETERAALRTRPGS